MWLTLAIALGALASKIFILDGLLDGALDRLTTISGYHELFSLVTTFYAFVAGFLLLYLLQEFSGVSEKFEQEVECWYRLHDLLHFFLMSNDGKSPKTPNAVARANDHAARKCFSYILTLDLGQVNDTVTLQKSVRALAAEIETFKVQDDNDQAALRPIIELYSRLQTHLRGRANRNIKPPRMLSFEVWLVATIVQAFAAMSLLDFFSVDLFKSAAGKFYFELAMAVIATPITLMNVTIGDLQKPFSGEWKIDVGAQYKDLIHMLESQSIRRVTP